MTVLVGAFAGTAYVVGLTLLGGEVADELRGRTFGLVQSLMRIDLLVVAALTPFIVGSIGRPPVTCPAARPDMNGVSVTLLVAGLLAITVGVLAFRQMDDRPGVPLRATCVRRSIPGGQPAPAGAGLFVVFEGGEGAGKSTQVALLARLAAGGRPRGVVHPRAGGDPARRPRPRAAARRAPGSVAPRAEALLYAADRAQHVAAVVRAGAGAGRGRRQRPVRRLVAGVPGRWAHPRRRRRGSAVALGHRGARPDLTVLLDVDPAVGLARVDGRAAGPRTGWSPSRPTSTSGSRPSSLRWPGRDPGRYLVVPATCRRRRSRPRVRAAGDRPAPGGARAVPAGSR